MSRNRIVLVTIGIMLSLFLASCQQIPKTSTPSPTVIQPLPSPSPVPTFPSIEHLFNATPTSLDFSRLVPITAENAADLKPFLGLTQDRIHGFAWSPDGNFIVAATSHGPKLYSSLSLKEKPMNLSPFLAQSSLVKFSPTGTMMAWIETGNSGELGLWLWNLMDSKKISIPLPNGNLAGLSFNPSGQLVVATIYNNSIQIWQAENGKMIASFSDAGDANWVDFSPDGRLIVSVGHSDWMAHVWNIGTGEEVGTIGKPNMPVESVKFSPIGNTLALGYLGSVQLWDVDAWHEISYLGSSNQRSVRGLAFSPNGNLLAVSIAFERKMLIVDSELKQIAEIDNGGAVFSPDGKYLAVVSDSELKIFDTASWKLQDSIPPLLGRVQHMVFRPDKPVLVSIHKEGITVAWDLQTGAEISRISSPGEHVLSPDGKLLAVGTKSGEVSVWDIDTSKLLKTYQRTSKYGVSTITFSQDNHLLTLSYQDDVAMSVVFLDLETDQEPRVFPLDEGLGFIGALTPDGSKLAVRIWKNEISTNAGVWDTQTNDLLWTSKRSDGAWISSAALHPNGEILAIGDRWNGSISLYDANSGTLLETLNEPPGGFIDYAVAVNDIIFSHNGKYMVTIINGGVVVWDLEKHTSIDIDRSCSRPSESLVFSQDDSLFMIAGGENLATNITGGGGGGGVCIWETQTGKLLSSSGWEDSGTSDFATFNQDRTMLAIDDNGTIWLWGILK